MGAKIVSEKLLYDGWCKLSRVRLRMGDGTEFDREIEHHGHAVAVLPYEPYRRTVMLVRLLRAPLLLTAGVAELLEAPAGLIEERDPVDAAKREVFEETGLYLRGLEHIGTVWTMPGLSTELMHIYLASYSDDDRIASGGGLSNENENITVVEMPIIDLWEMVQSHRVMDMKTVTLTFALRHWHPELF